MQPSPLRNKVILEMKKDSMVPAFSSAAERLNELVSQEAPLKEIAEVVNLEPGLAAKVLRLSNSAAFGGKSIQHIDEALFRIGVKEIRKLAMAIGVMDRVSHLRVKVNWNLFWMHNLLTARLTEIIANTYRPPTGREYLAGLMHDIGKLFLEHHFAQDFEAIMLRAMERSCGMFAAENQLYDITHAEVGSMLCEKWGLHQEIVRAIRFHHDPSSPFCKDPNHPEDEHLLAACICLADALANRVHANIQGAESHDNIQVEALPEWKNFEKQTPISPLDFDLTMEVQKVQDTINSLTHQPVEVAGPQSGKT